MNRQELVERVGTCAGGGFFLKFSHRLRKSSARPAMGVSAPDVIGGRLDRTPNAPDTEKMGATDLVNELVLDRFPETQALYLFGSARTILARGDGSAASASVGGDRAPQAVRRQGGNTNDIDLALLLPPLRAKEIGTLAFSDLRFELEKRLGRDVDLINLRRSSTVFQNEVIASGEVILLGDRRGLDEFEMLTLSYYQKLNEERAEILKEFFAGGRAYRV